MLKVPEFPAVLRLKFTMTIIGLKWFLFGLVKETHMTLWPCSQDNFENISIYIIFSLLATKP